MKNDCCESEKRIEKHRDMRKDKGFITIECCESIGSISFSKEGNVLLECLGNLLANEMFKESICSNPNNKILNDIFALSNKCGNMVIVSNYVFSTIEGLSHESICYVRNLAYINNIIAQKADVVIEAVYSVANVIKGEKLCTFLKI